MTDKTNPPIKEIELMKLSDFELTNAVKDKKPLFIEESFGCWRKLTYNERGILPISKKYKLIVSYVFELSKEVYTFEQMLNEITRGLSKEGADRIKRCWRFGE